MGKGAAKSSGEACTGNQGETQQANAAGRCAVPDGGQYADRTGAGAGTEGDSRGKREEESSKETSRSFWLIQRFHKDVLATILNDYKSLSAAEDGILGLHL